MYATKPLYFTIIIIFVIIHFLTVSSFNFFNLTTTWKLLIMKDTQKVKSSKKEVLKKYINILCNIVLKSFFSGVPGLMPSSLKACSYFYLFKCLLLASILFCKTATWQGIL